MADDVKSDQPLRGGRQRANHIQVHRIELGLWERKHLGDVLSASLGSNIIKNAGIGLGVAGASVAVFMASKKLYGWAEDFTETAGGIKEAIFGAPSYKNKYGDEIKNPLAGFPILGSLMGSGMMIGNALLIDEENLPDWAKR